MAQASLEIRLARAGRKLAKANVEREEAREALRLLIIEARDEDPPLTMRRIAELAQMHFTGIAAIERAARAAEPD